MASDSSHRASGPAADGASPEQAIAPTSDARKTASGRRAAFGPGWPKPHVTVSPHTSATATITSSAATSRPAVRPASRPTQSATRAPTHSGR